MNFFVYLGVFVFTVVEEALKTLRIIVVSNGKKKLGAVLQFFVALIWIVVTGTVITNIKEDPFKVLFYAFGSLIGSFFGSYIEEMIAFGFVVLMVRVNGVLADKIVFRLRKDRYIINRACSGNGMEILMICVPRKKVNGVVEIIRSFDDDLEIVTEKVKVVSRL